MHLYALFYEVKMGFDVRHMPIRPYHSPNKIRRDLLPIGINRAVIIVYKYT